ncbi:ferric reductase-like transmembrane domain-containing protein [Neobacillus mesonae]|uniref:ferric reductase-like transmembrane domain-containing protein n=1 Tax=Neobacillus mesonae TaxID=1193713 RepID=UPI00082D7541|nr:ferric reductase-like transmembrane domain-containing protein [Neobacillus mesonae]
MNEYFSVWTFIRTSGFLAYYLLTLSLAAGMLGSFSKLRKKKAALIVFHQSCSWFGFLTILFHILLLLKDQYVPYSVKQLLVPFLAENKPLFSGLGTLSFYLFFLVIGSSDFLMKKLGRKNWRKLHFAVIPAWGLTVVHGIGIGTDSTEPWAQFLYTAGIMVILIVGILRYIESVVIRHQSERGKPINE